VDRGVVLTEPGRVALEEIELDAPGPNEVQVRVAASGVCRSDLHVIEQDGWGHRLPVLLGHEGAGVVEQVGEGVEGLEPGDRVVLGWRAPCGVCGPCRRGDPRRCARPASAARRLHLRDGRKLTHTLRMGTFATRTIVHSAAAVRIRDELPLDQACLIGCAVATGVCSVLETAQVWPGARVAVIGCGAVGISAIQGARIAGAAEIHAIDPDARKLEAARAFGATHAGEPEEVDFAFDVVGRPETLELAIHLLGHAGTAVLVGLPKPDVAARIELAPFFDMRSRVLVSHGGDHLPAADFPRLARWALEGKLDLEGMVSKRISLADVDAAFEDMARGDVIRSVIEIDEE
jgi:S-(hydroxymethyl)mycothiol dehydrogenase